MILDERWRLCCETFARISQVNDQQMEAFVLQDVDAITNLFGLICVVPDGVLTLLHAWPFT